MLAAATVEAFIPSTHPYLGRAQVASRSLHPTPLWYHAAAAAQLAKRCTRCRPRKTLRSHSAVVPGAAPLSRPARRRTALTDYLALLDQRVPIATGCVSLRLFFLSFFFCCASAVDRGVLPGTREGPLTSLRQEEGTSGSNPQPPGDFEFCRTWTRDSCPSTSSNVQSSVAREKRRPQTTSRRSSSTGGATSPQESCCRPRFFPPSFCAVAALAHAAAIFQFRRARSSE